MYSSPFLWIHCLLAIALLVMALAFMAHFSNNILLEYDEEVIRFAFVHVIYYLRQGGYDFISVS